VARSLGLPREDIPDEQNAATYYIQAMNALPERDRDDEELWNQYRAALDGPWGPEQERLYEWFGKTADARRLFKHATGMERCQFPLLTGQSGDTFIFSLLMPPLRGLRQLSRLMAIEGHLLENQGQVREALEDYLAAFQVGVHLGNGPFLISGLVCLAAQRISTEAMENGLARQEVGADVLEWLAGELDGLGDSLPDRAAWIVGERAAVIQLVSMSPQALLALEGQSHDVSAAREAFLSSRAFRVLWPDRTMKRDFERFYDALEQLARKPTWEVAAELRQTSGDELLGQYFKDWNILGWMLAPAFGAALERYTKDICDFDALRVNVALRRFRTDRGAYPERLDELVPDYLKELPPDPFTGQPFRYRREDDGWTLYSLGSDQEDDGGESSDYFGKEGDIVYRSHLAEEEE